MQVNKSGEHIGARRIYRFQRDALAADDIIKIERPLFKGTFFGIVNLSADNSCFMLDIYEDTGTKSFVSRLNPFVNNISKDPY